MMRNNLFSVALLAATLPSLSLAQLPRECFYVTDLHGTQSDDSMLLSNLPMLMAMYEPGMRMNSVVAYQDDGDDEFINVAGISLNLKTPGKDDEL